MQEAPEPRELGAGGVVRLPVSPEGGPWQLPDHVYEADLGDGAAGRVVRARHEATGTPVAITYLPPALAEDAGFRAAFRAEAELLGNLDSPYVARLHAYVEDGPRAAIVTESVDGVGLDVLLRDKGATAPEPALAVLKGSLLGLAAVHGAGLVHGDHRPARVLVTAEGAVKVAGFGVSARGAQDGTPAGTPVYMSPERWAGGPATAACDVYAAVVTFYECLTGTTPYAGATMAELADGYAAAPVPDGNVPEPVRSLVARGLTKDPAERPQDAAEFAGEVEAVATAAYGEGWEDRGHRGLAALVGLLLPPSGGVAPDTAPPARTAPEPVATEPVATEPGIAPLSGAGAGGVRAGKGPAGAGGRGPRFGRRAKILAVAVAAVLVAGAVAVTAVATGSDDDTAAVRPAPAVGTSLISAPAPVAAPPSAEATTASPAASPSASRPAATAAAPTTPVAQPPATPADSRAAAPGAVPTTPSAGPAKTAGSAGGPHVASVAVTSFACAAGSHTATATVFVRYDGAAAGTLHLTWWRSSTGRPAGAATMTPQTARFPKGATSYTFTDTLTFTPGGSRPYVGLTVSTDPAADSGNGSYGVGCH
ncbi:serine/threonine-protein kinase [Actinacidiphila sp. ITFR-21]|uniref:serine/threonine-protein kinase n=1 Tax=Actinacidiphila sp. ITFR-21 TaxID=3075199 RepID=UPI00288BA75F|nr:serine/threonine-protein kinase [Streptomyces sp. ITFR-21]WNI14103.1 serine/threonine-protein kinase [Streptomyces sp. ITFR-21]